MIRMVPAQSCQSVDFILMAYAPTLKDVNKHKLMDMVTALQGWCRRRNESGFNTGDNTADLSPAGSITRRTSVDTDAKERPDVRPAREQETMKRTHNHTTVEEAATITRHNTRATRHGHAGTCSHRREWGFPLA